MSDNTIDPRRGITRRTLAVGAAWSVPVIAAATAAPALAVSGPPPSLAYGSACKNPGYSCATQPKGYTIPVTICNSSSLDIYIYTVTYSNVVGTNLQFVYAPPPTLPLLIPANKCLDVFFNATSTNSANSVFTMDVTVTWGHTATPGSDPYPHPALTQNLAIPGTPPTCGCVNA